MRDPAPTADWLELSSYLTDIVKQEGFKQNSWAMTTYNDVGQVLACIDSPSKYAAIVRQEDGWSLVLRTENKDEAPSAKIADAVRDLVARYAG